MTYSEELAVREKRQQARDRATLDAWAARGYDGGRWPKDVQDAIFRENIRKIDAIRAEILRKRGLSV